MTENETNDLAAGIRGYFDGRKGKRVVVRPDIDNPDLLPGERKRRLSEHAGELLDKQGPLSPQEITDLKSAIQDTLREGW